LVRELLVTNAREHPLPIFDAPPHPTLAIRTGKSAEGGTPMCGQAKELRDLAVQNARVRMVEWSLAGTGQHEPQFEDRSEG
jgi:hypothetical protein